MEHIVRAGAIDRSDSPGTPAAVFWVQGITLAWMLVECAVSLYAASAAHSAALLAFGSDSLVELLSAAIALLSFIPSFRLDKERAAHWEGALLYVLAAIVAAVAIASLAGAAQAKESYLGLAITIAALIIMPALAWSKRKLGSSTGARALEADAVQSSTCAYLALVTLIGLAANAVFHIHWVDSAAALAVLPILVVEGRKARRGESCDCCG